VSKTPASKIEDLSPRQQEPQALTTEEAEAAKGGNLVVGGRTTRSGWSYGTEDLADDIFGGFLGSLGV
jgi:hypothetical protein